MTTEQQLEHLLQVLVLGVEMRSLQAAYFKTRTSDNLIASKNAERAFDKAANTALIGLGHLIPQQQRKE